MQTGSTSNGMLFALLRSAGDAQRHSEVNVECPLMSCSHKLSYWSFPSAARGSREANNLSGYAALRAVEITTVSVGQRLS